MKSKTSRLMFVAIAFALLATTALAEKVNVLYSFKGTSGGDTPLANFISDTAGNLYGVTGFGGINCDNTGNGCGTVFELSPPAEAGGVWSKTTIYKFHGSPDGAYPSGGRLLMDKEGNLYGATINGGVANCDASGVGCGVFYQLTPPTQKGGAWKETVVYSFKGGRDGFEPGGLVFGSQDKIYGFTSYGGITGQGYGYGTVFQLSKSSGGAWVERILYRFQNTSDGSSPSYMQTLLRDEKGNLYGTTIPGDILLGTSFELSPPKTKGAAWTETTIADVGSFWAGLISDKAGNLYGTNFAGSTGNGSVFELSPERGGGWNATTIFSFSGSDGSQPMSALTLDASGNLYGTTYTGGKSNVGTVYKLAPSGQSWTQTVLHSFIGFGVDGREPSGGLLERNGLLYGTTQGNTAFSIRH